MAEQQTEAPLGDIWSTGAFAFESPLKDLLDSGTYTLEQLLAEDELLQELRGRHPQLMQFFSNPQAVQRLIEHVIHIKLDEETIVRSEPIVQETTTKSEDDGDTNHSSHPPPPGQWLFPPVEEPSVPPTPRSPEEEQKLQEIRYPYMACEILCCEINSIIDTFVDGHVVAVKEAKPSEEEEEEENGVGDPRPQLLLDLFFSVLYDTPVGELDDYRAGYFEKILTLLLRKRPKTMSTYINEGGGRGPFVLMKAMMKHLYSHSIMQLVQRLLLPHPSSFVANEEEEDNDDSDKNGDSDDEMHATFRCRWSDSPDAIELLLESLIVPTSEQTEDLRLDESQNASEILITVIQNSPLTSANMIALTTSPILDRIVKAASFLEEGATFSLHDSSLTSSINVMESIVLQLGGFGSVGTPVAEAPDDQSMGIEDLVNGQDPPHENGKKATSNTKRDQVMATPHTLVELLPDLLQALCRLLRHPCTETWLSPTQFSKEEPQRRLGMSRLRIVRLLESLVLLGDARVDQILCESDCLPICLDLFWEFQWCSMLHQSVANLLVHVFEGANERGKLQELFLIKCNLLERLMTSFEEEEEEAEDDEAEDKVLSDAVMAMKELENRPSPPSRESEKGSTDSDAEPILSDDGEAIPVSDDDVDVALEQETAAMHVMHDETQLEKEEMALATEEEATKPKESWETPSTSPEVPTLTDEAQEGEPTDMKSSIPSFRMGYMGHVIIICQALVHACSSAYNDTAVELESSEALATIDLDASAPIDTKDKLVNENSAASLDFDHDDSDTYDEEDAADADDRPENQLVIAKLIESLPLRSKWDEFVATTLAAETAIQSAALGGFASGNPSSDPLHSHNPALRRTSGFPDEGEGPGPGKGILVDGDVIDMDDNDLDIAASMMDAFSNLRNKQSGTDSEDYKDEDSNVEDMRRGVNVTSFVTDLQKSGGTSGDYLFDDPLGSSRFADDDSDDEEDEDIIGSGSSPGFQGPNEPEKEEDEDVPVMDLFAGNFAFGKEQPGQPDAQVDAQTEDAWSNFANFDDAFAAADSSSADTDAEDSGIASENSGLPLAFGEELSKPDVDDIFGTSQGHALLIDETADANVKVEKPEDAATSGEETVHSPTDMSKPEESSCTCDEPGAQCDENTPESSLPANSQQSDGRSPEEVEHS